jgi:primase-polymerase (primpol)-like protein
VDARRADGIGFMLHDSGYAAFDIDDCRDPDTGEIAKWAQSLIH